MQALAVFMLLASLTILITGGQPHSGETPFDPATTIQENLSYGQNAESHAFSSAWTAMPIVSMT